MDKRKHIERIIIGSLLNDDDEQCHYEDVRCCTQSDMFSEPQCGELYNAIVELHKKGISKTWPDEVYNLFEGKMNESLLRFMYDLATNYDFLSMKVKYNESLLFSNVYHKTLTDVSFSDYVSKFLDYAIG